MFRNHCLLHLQNLLLVLIAPSPLLAANLTTQEWSIPIAGNIYRTEPGPGGRSHGRGEGVSIQSIDEVHSVYVRFNHPAKIEVALTGKASSGSGAFTIKLGNQEFQGKFDSSNLEEIPLGDFEVTEPGYARFDFKKAAEAEDSIIELHTLRVVSSTEGLKLDFVRNNDGNMFYWGRRGPSVHLGYQVPQDVKLQYAYSEITVPVGEDPLGTYYMAIGFGEGYFGIQVNGPDERRVLFSVWSPFNTDNPKDIPEDQRIEAMGQGPNVRIGEFGNEGSGGQSFLVYPWKAGKTYRFLVEVTPGEGEKTIYTAWFGEKESNNWQLIASFRRPKTNTHLRGFHSFLESFSPTHGYIGRRAIYGNPWVRDVEGNWHEIVKARFTVDATGGGGHRMDFIGGVNGQAFYLRNCGFFTETGVPGTIFQRESSAGERPQIDLSALPR